MWGCPFSSEGERACLWAGTLECFADVLLVAKGSRLMQLLQEPTQGGQDESSGLPKAQKSPLGGVASVIHRDTQRRGWTLWSMTSKKAQSSVPAWCHCQGRDCPIRCPLLPHMYSPLPLAPSAAHHCQSFPCAHSHYRYRKRYTSSREKKTCYMVLPLQERLPFVLSFPLFSLHTPDRHLLLLTDTFYF